MSDNNDSLDDIFDEIFLLEEKFEAQGRTDGIQYARKASQLKGQQVGVKFGYQIGKELGFYTTTLHLWYSLISQNIMKNQTVRKKQKALMEISKLLDLIEQLVLIPSNESLTEQIDHIKGKFKLVKTLIDRSQWKAFKVNAHQKAVLATTALQHKPIKQKKTSSIVNISTTIDF